MTQSHSIFIPREVLLIEIDRRCFFPDCVQRAFIGLTRDEARNYAGFECLHCKRWNEDMLTDGEIPESWSEIKRRRHSFLETLS